MRQKAVMIMSDNASDYVTQMPEGGWRIAGTRVSLDSIVHAYFDGSSPESIASDFPSLSLEQVHGALAFYLRHRVEIDQFLSTQSERWNELRQQQSKDPLLERLRKARQGRVSARKTG